MCHSGSRNLGKKIGDYFNALAENLNSKWYSEGRDVPYLPVDTIEGKAYLAWLDFALRFAFLSRCIMLEKVQSCFEHKFPNIKWTTDDIKGAKDNVINIHHNDANLENHMGKNYWVHRKGATRAFEGQLGIIPGSMGTPSYITVGKGERLSLMSSSHGAGRKMGRMEYSRLMKDNYAEVEKSLEGVVHSDFSKFDRGKMKGILDVSESPGAYKDIDLVMSNQVDLVNPIVKLKPLICLKG